MDTRKNDTFKILVISRWVSQSQIRTGNMTTEIVEYNDYKTACDVVDSINDTKFGNLISGVGVIAYPMFEKI